MRINAIPLLLVLVLWISCCSSDTKDVVQDETAGEQEGETNKGVAIVTDVSVTGEENQYTFSVTISSPDLGCQQYADWWEVIDLDGNLLYRRVLAHSHVNEQPFTRSGAPFDISSNKEVYIRAHMNTTGYSNKVFKGAVANGFSSTNLDNDFAKNLEEVEPLPDTCAF